MASHSGSGLTLKCAIKESDGRSKTRESEQWILSKIQVRSYNTGDCVYISVFPSLPLLPKTLKSTFHIQSHFFCWLYRQRCLMLKLFTWVEARLHLNNESCATDIWKGAGWKRWRKLVLQTYLYLYFTTSFSSGVISSVFEMRSMKSHVLLLASVQWLVVHGVGFAEGEGVACFPLRLKQIGKHPSW